MERIDGEHWSLIVDADCEKDLDGRWVFYHVSPTLTIEGMRRCCCTVNRELQEVRIQVCLVPEGRRPGHVLWRERAERRINQLDDGKMIPWNLIRRA